MTSPDRDGFTQLAVTQADQAIQLLDGNQAGSVARAHVHAALAAVSATLATVTQAPAPPTPPEPLGPCPCGECRGTQDAAPRTPDAPDRSREIQRLALLQVLYDVTARPADSWWKDLPTLADRVMASGVVTVDAARVFTDLVGPPLDGMH